MATALDLARAQVGRTVDNPAVGCVLVKDSQIIGWGATADGGRPHGEVMALKGCADASGATAYVTLEPCSHYGRSGPCADALIAAGVIRCVISLTDPNPAVNGGGIAKLKAAGVIVEIGDGAAQAREIMADFLARH